MATSRFCGMGRIERRSWRATTLGLAVAGGLAVMAAPARAQQSIHGDCNVQLGAGSNNNSVTIICLPGLGSGASKSRGAASDTRSLVLDAAVERLQAGRRSFEVVLRNRSANRRAEIVPGWLSLSDDQGNAYDLDCLAMACVTRKVIPPGRTIRISVSLNRTIDDAAGEVFFTLSDIWSAARASQHRHPFGAVEWTVPVSHGPVDNSDLERAERAIGLTSQDRRNIQYILNEMGFASGSPSGRFNAQTRRAIASWQDARGYPATGYLDRRQAMDLNVSALKAQQQGRMERHDQEFDTFKRQNDEARRRMDADFERRWGQPPPW